ncbi:MAG: CpsD/CapB family tyrosine-protein kinase [Clostridia bacterium]|nr:CpsD/CapB family tyrosine-protein kinase [Clostridia bacterium]
MNTVNLITKTPERYEVKEAFKTLRTNVLFSGSDTKVIAITSSTQNEGKSFVSLELSKSLAESGKKVLLIDSDLRKSVLAEKHIEEQDLLGLSHYLSGQAECDEIVYGTQYPDFYIAFAGPYPPNPVELIGSKRFSEMLEYYRSVFDYIIIDTPPLGLVIDAAVIAAQCDGVILNVAANHVSYRTLQSIKAQLTRSGCHIIGAVLNMAESAHYSYKSYMLGKRYYDKPYGNYSANDSYEQKQYAKLGGNADSGENN